MYSLPDDDTALYGAPTIKSDNAGASVNPMMSSESGGTDFGNANPFSKGPFMADGGAIPDGDDDDDLGSTANADPTTKAFSGALRAVNSALMYGRQKHGLPTNDKTEENAPESDGSSDADEGALSFAEGGAVPDDNELSFYGMDKADAPIDMNERLGSLRSPPDDNSDNSGAAPVAGIPEDDSGAAPVAPADAQGGDQRGAAQTVLSYLMGADGVAPQVLDNYKADTQGTEADRNLLAVERASQEGGDQGAWGVLQALRRKFDLFMNHGRAAVDKGDFQSAAQSATQAMANLPDGENISFAPTRDGIVAQVHSAGGQPAQIPLQKQAADAFMNTGKDGQFDGLLERGASSVLQNLQRGTATIGKVGAGFSTPGAAPGAPQKKENMDPNAVKIFGNRGGPTNGWGQPLPGSTPSAKDWKSQALLDREKMRQEGLTKRETMRTDRQGAALQSKMAATAQQLEQRATNARERDRFRAARSEITNPNFLLQTEEQRNAIYKKFGLDQMMQGSGQQEQPAAPAPQAQQQPSGNASPAQRPANAPQGSKFFQGKWYTRGPNGEAVEVK